MTPAQRQQRQNIRAFLLTADRNQIEHERDTSDDKFRASCCQEMLDEMSAGNVENYGDLPL